MLDAFINGARSFAQRVDRAIDRGLTKADAVFQGEIKSLEDDLRTMDRYHSGALEGTADVTTGAIGGLSVSVWSMGYGLLRTIPDLVRHPVDTTEKVVTAIPDGLVAMGKGAARGVERLSEGKLAEGSYELSRAGTDIFSCLYGAKVLLSGTAAVVRGGAQLAGREITAAANAVNAGSGGAMAMAGGMYLVDGTVAVRVAAPALSGPGLMSAAVAVASMSSSGNPRSRMCVNDSAIQNISAEITDDVGRFLTPEDMADMRSALKEIQEEAAKGDALTQRNIAAQLRDIQNRFRGVMTDADPNYMAVEARSALRDLRQVDGSLEPAPLERHITRDRMGGNWRGNKEFAAAHRRVCIKHGIDPTSELGIKIGRDTHVDLKPQGIRGGTTAQIEKALEDTINVIGSSPKKARMTRQRERGRYEWSEQAEDAGPSFAVSSQ